MLLQVTYISTFLFTLVRGSCFFPTELQGSYAVQYVEGDKSDIWYRSVSIGYNFISGVGHCVLRQAERYIVQHQESGCYKCVGLEQRSYNVLTMTTPDTCHVSPDLAWIQCLGLETEAGVKTDMMYRAGNKIRPYQCPITGRFTVSCPGDTGDTGAADTCPDESQLSIRCPGQEELSFTCLGHWSNADGDQYLSLLDRVLPQIGEEARPRWRCAKYERRTGDIVLTLSEDSTCDKMISGDMILTRAEAAVSSSLTTDIALPDWSQGEWDSVSISGGHIVIRSQDLLTTHHLTTVQSHQYGIYTVLVNTDCGVTGYACLDIMGRGDKGHILEISLGQIYNHRHQVKCGLRRDKQIVKMTQLKHREECPMPGEWQGEIPDGEGLCARSVTSCGDPSMMKYQVYNCARPEEVYEDRLYSCYGQYSHGGQVYTLTKRHDLSEKQECFVGVTSVTGEHRVMEAGEHCDRGQQPQLYGMVMEQVKPQDCSTEDSDLDTNYLENVAGIEMKLLNPKLKLQVEDHHHHQSHSSSAASSSLSVISSVASLLLLVYYSL